MAVPGRVAVLAAVLLAALAATAAAHAAQSCGSGAHGKSGYGYAGHQSAKGGSGVRAAITATSSPTVRDGHVAGWVGVGGPGAGPGGADQWLQVGLAALPGSGLLVYAEITRAGRQPVFRLLELDIAPGTTRTIAVRETERRGWWRGWVDGKPVTKPVHLPGMAAVQPMATAESWNGGSSSCNRFAFRFDEVVVADPAQGTWRPFVTGFRFRDAGFSVRPLAPSALGGTRALAAQGRESFAFLASAG